MKTVGTYYKSEQAHLVASLLEGDGLEVHVLNELTIETDWLLAQANGGIRVCVSEADYARALEVLIVAEELARAEGDTTGPFA